MKLEMDENIADIIRVILFLAVLIVMANLFRGCAEMEYKHMESMKLLEIQQKEK